MHNTEPFWTGWYWSDRYVPNKEQHNHFSHGHVLLNTIIETVPYAQNAHRLFYRISEIKPDR